MSILKHSLLAALVAYLGVATAGISLGQEAADDATPSTETAAEPEITPLTIGSPAPQLDIEHWIQDGNGHFSKVTEFEADKVYVVEFWATWCGPCIASMPHIVEVQKQYADRGVQVVSVTREDVETVEAFLEKEVRGASEGAGEDAKIPTYRDLTSAYCLTADPDNSTSNDYMRAAGQNGIPCAFIVGKDAKVEWIGHPMTMDEPLEQIVTDSWDRAAFAEEFKVKQQADLLMAKISQLMRAKETGKAVEVLDEFLASTNNEEMVARFTGIKLQVLLSDPAMAEQAAKVASEMLGNDELDARGVNTIAWNLYRYAAMGRIDNDELLQAAIQANESKLDSAGEYKPYLLDTIAHLHLKLGNLDAAVAAQEQAIEVADPAMKVQLQRFLNQLKSEVEKAAEADAKEADGEPEAEAKE